MKVAMPWHELLGFLPSIQPSAGLGDWYAQVVARVGKQGPFALAVYGGRMAATPGLAFLAGYQAALRALWANAPEGIGALCVTENRKLHPSDMATRVKGVLLTGSKDFVTAGASASWLLVSAREEQQDEPVRLGLFVVRPENAGVQLETGRPLPLVPDIPHARLRLEQAYGERLGGDGWSDYVKPFRSLEDLYVLAALTAWLLGVGLQHHWPQGLVLRLIAVLTSGAELGRQSPHDSTTYVLLGALIEQFHVLRSELDSALEATAGPWADLWRRDNGVLELGRNAQTLRLQKAMRAFGIFSEDEASVQ
ncbi:MAG: acyl-CoA dehydrogenase [Pseudomonas sp.]